MFILSYRIRLNGPLQKHGCHCLAPFSKKSLSTGFYRVPPHYCSHRLSPKSSWVWIPVCSHSTPLCFQYDVSALNKLINWLQKGRGYSSWLVVHQVFTPIFSSRLFCFHIALDFKPSFTKTPRGSLIWYHHVFPFLGLTLVALQPILLTIKWKIR